MTVSYAGEVPNGSSFGCFWKILWKWRGSVYKLVWRELIAYLCLYYTINLLYRFVFTKDQQVLFNRLREYFGKQSETIPMSFVLGFYVTLIVKRWWEQYRLLPWPDTLALFISAAIPNTNGGVNNETGRLMRRNIMRYMVLSYVITLQRISLRVKRRFPTTQHLVDAGLMHESEMKIFEALNQKSPMSKYWMPLVWATNIINRARKEGLIISDHIVQTILMELSDIRRRLGGLIGYDTVCVPLVYTQVVTLVLYTYFIAALLGRQMLPNMVDTSKSELDTDLYFPLFLVLQFAFYVGWLKVAEVLINPFGEDDDDIELNWLIDRHIKAAYMIVDEMHEEHPELLRDQYWECVVPANLPYTVASEHYRRAEPKGSAEKFKVKKEDAMYANIMPGKRMNDDVYADYESVDTPMVERRKNNWLVRQLSRMGSVRSQSTAYSSSGLAFNRNRLNSVYSSPESGMPLSIMQQQHLQQQQQQQQQQMNQTNMQSKPSLYEKFVHRKSIRAHKQLIKQNSRINGLNVNGPKTRPRIPTPDVNKEPGERDSNGKLIIAPLTTATTSAPTISSTTTNKPNAPPPPNALLMSKKAPMQYPQYTANAPATPPTSSGAGGAGGVGGGAQDRVFGTLLLSPIKEMDNSSSSNNTLIAGHPATTALAQTVLPPNVTDMSFGVATQMPVTTSITTLSFPFTVNTSSADTIPTGSTLNIVPLQANQMPTITTTTSNGYDGKDVITTIPVSLSIQRSPSALTITELAGNGDDQKQLNDATATTTTTTALLSIKPVGNGGGGVQRTGSFNANLGLTLQEPFVMERNTSIRSAGQAEAAGSNQAELAPTSSTLGVTSTAQSSSSSAPSTLAKQKPEERTGEVYV